MKLSTGNEGKHVMTRIEQIKKYGSKAKGRKELRSHLNGTRITSGEAILAKCYDCCGYYADGKADCRIQECPLYGFMPYRDIRHGDA